MVGETKIAFLLTLLLARPPEQVYVAIVGVVCRTLALVAYELQLSYYQLVR